MEFFPFTVFFKICKQEDKFKKSSGKTVSYFVSYFSLLLLSLHRVPLGEFLFFLFIYRLVISVKKLKDKEKKFATIGVLSYLSFQIFVNIGMNLGVVPTTGIPLPFISYGGSNLIINVLAVGLVMKFLNERSTF